MRERCDQRYRLMISLMSDFHEDIADSKRAVTVPEVQSSVCAKPESPHNTSRCSHHLQA